MASIIFLLFVVVLAHQTGRMDDSASVYVIAAILLIICIIFFLITRKFKIASQIIQDIANIVAIVAFISGLVIFVYEFAIDPTRKMPPTVDLSAAKINPTIQIPPGETYPTVQPLSVEAKATLTRESLLSNISGSENFPRQRISSIDGMVQLLVPSGEFEIGAADGDTSAEDIERPRHSVYLDEFYIDQTEVTNAMWVMCVKAGNCRNPAKNNSHLRSKYYGETAFADYPVIFVTWEEADAYCRWAGRTLPSEAQWEKAARGNDLRRWPWGDEAPSGYQNLLNYVYSGTGDTTVVGSYPSGKSPYGALDMAGNVWEWVKDFYSPSYYSSSPRNNPAGPEIGGRRVLRGGSWNNQGRYVRSSNRYSAEPSYTSNEVGFRCAEIP